MGFICMVDNIQTNSKIAMGSERWTQIIDSFSIWQQFVKIPKSNAAFGNRKPCNEHGRHASEMLPNSNCTNYNLLFKDASAYYHKLWLAAKIITDCAQIWFQLEGSRCHCESVTRPHTHTYTSFAFHRFRFHIVFEMLMLFHLTCTHSANNAIRFFLFFSFAQITKTKWKRTKPNSNNNNKIIDKEKNAREKNLIRTYEDNQM